MFALDVTSLPAEKDYNPSEFSIKILREAPMPVYDYLCKDCHKEFEKVLSLNEHDHFQIRCPHCGSGNVEQEAKAFFAVTSKKS
jgi:putative FmdB family regulatory protein